jgi:hypothetical protein
MRRDWRLYGLPKRVSRLSGEEEGEDQMPVADMDIQAYGTAVMPDSDATQDIGGAIDLTKKVTWARLTAATEDTLNAVSSGAGDTTQKVTVTMRRPSGAIETEDLNLNGTTEVAGAKTANRILKSVKDATCAGTVAVYSDTIEEASKTALGGATTYVDLAADASAVDNYYQGMVWHSKTGTGANQVAEIVTYDGTLQRAYVRTLATAPSTDTVYDIMEGQVFEKSPNEIMEVRRICYAAAAEPSTGSERNYYEKFAIKNEHATLAMTNCYVAEDQTEGAYARTEFALETSKDGSGKNGAGNNRQVAPSAGITAFSDADKLVPTGNLDAGEYIGVWIKLNLPAGQAAASSHIRMILKGDSI